MLPQAAHPAHILLVGHGVDHGACAQEQQGFKEAVGHQVEDTGGISRNTKGEEHVSQLGTGGVRDNPFNVVLHAADGGCKERRTGTNDGNDGQCRVGILEQR